MKEILLRLKIKIYIWWMQKYLDDDQIPAWRNYYKQKMLFKLRYRIRLDKDCKLIRDFETGRIF